MGLFSNHYNRPGPGVPKDAPKKKPFFLFWELYFRKFFPLIRVNLLFCVPVAVVLVMMFLLIPFNNLFIMLIPMILLSPFVAGLTYVTRNYAREEHAFIFSDFVDAIKKNWKAFLVNGVLCYLLTVLFTFAITYYSGMLSTNNFFYVPFALCVCLAFVSICSQYYIPVMLITFDLKFVQVVKNGLIFAVIGLWRNLIISLVLGVFVFAIYASFVLGPYLPILPLVLILLLVFLLFSFSSFLINFTVYPLIEKLMIKPYQEKSTEESTETAAGDFHDRTEIVIKGKR